MTSFAERMGELRCRFLARAEGEMEGLITAIERGDLDEIGSISHRLAGIAGIFGFRGLGDAAAQVEERLEGRASAAEVDRSCRALVAELRAALRAASEA